ncbi:MAG: hypothetical protein NC177_00015 [Ruminococcus flavefaciens]|nr:hypothetical protein [Ruminococcus flavefaciens]
MLNNEFYSELRRIIQEETKKFADSVTDRCIELIEEYTSENPVDFLLDEDEPPCTMPVLDSVEDIISAMSGNFEKVRQEIQNKNNNS